LVVWNGGVKPYHANASSPSEAIGFGARTYATGLQIHPENRAPLSEHKKHPEDTRAVKAVLVKAKKTIPRPDSRAGVYSAEIYAHRISHSCAAQIEAPPASSAPAS
jgi:hypothetical protein